MDLTTVVSLTLLIFAGAALYSSVGHAGASGYLAAMALFSLSPSVMKPTALSLNILVAAIAFTMFYRAGYFSWSIYWPFGLGAIPFAFIGGGLTLPGAAYKIVVGIVLIYAAVRLFLTVKNPPTVKQSLPVGAAVPIGIGIGFLSGLTGVGGGIFLSPLLLLMGWADPRTTSAVSSAFILVNSIAGLLGHYSAVSNIPDAIPLWAVAAAGGGLIGARYGSRKFSNPIIRRMLSLVLVVAGLKMILA
jgi:uncharacterized membrane protein YfcA